MIEDWADTLREGDIEGAAEFSRCPAWSRTAPPPSSFEIRQQVVEFNEALPCGAEFVSAETAGDYTIATFEPDRAPWPRRVRRRRRQQCQDRLGISDEGEIERWIRVVDLDDASLLPPDDGPVV